MDRKEQAIALRGNKYNCCQAVTCVFADELGLDKELLFRISEGFGLGMGSMEGHCGSMYAGIILAGITSSDGNLENPCTKAATYKVCKDIMAKFKEKTGAQICKELKGVETGQMLCSCADCVKAGVETVEEVLGL